MAEAKKNKFVSILFVLIIPAAILLFGCSGNPSETEEVADEQRTQESALEQELLTENSAYFEDDWEENESSVIDAGDGCRFHSYRLKPGATETLEFENLLRKKPRDMSPVIETTREVLSGQGIDISIIGTDIETHVATYPVWAVDLNDFKEYQVVQESGRLFLGWSNFGRGLKGITGVKHVTDSYYIISSIDGRDWHPSLISKMSYDDLHEKLEGDMMVHHQDQRSGKTESFPVVQIDVEKEFYIAKLYAHVSISNADQLPEEIAGEQNWYYFQQVGDFHIRCVYNKKRRPEVSIEGPAYHPGCFFPW